MASLNFAANISTMFKEVSVLERFGQAKRKGFAAVEAQDLYSHDFDAIVAAQRESGVRVVLINSVASGTSGENSGMACNLGKQEEFLQGLQRAKDLAVRLNCKKIHVLAGIPKDDETDSLSRLEEVYLKNLETAAKVLGENNITALIEPICKEVKPNYFLDNYDKAVEYIKKIGNSNLKLQMDIFHMKMLGIDPKEGIEKYYPYTGHIQISQAPSRHEPSFAGDVDYKDVFHILKEKHHTDYIGLEYTPSGATDDSLGWMQKLL